MAASSKIPLISIVIPTLNSASVLNSCLSSIRQQKYPQEKIEILLADGGSKDETTKIAAEYKCKIFKNRLKTAESGKALGIKKSRGEYIALIDSDNILPSDNWLNIMLTPFNDPKIIGAEPWEYTYRPNGGYIERYSALTGVNDPYALIANNYDRKNLLRSGWNGLGINIVDHRYYQSFRIKHKDRLPSIGANGTIYRSQLLRTYFNSDYLIDVDLLTQILPTTKILYFAKVKCGIIHSYCESSITKFVSKQRRRVTDLYIFPQFRPKEIIISQKTGILLFSLYVIFIIPMLVDTFKGFVKKPDFAWFFHPIACILTLYIYGYISIKNKIGILKPIDRQQWHQ